MTAIPIEKTDITELMFTVTGYMIATVILLDEYFAFWASFPLFEMFFKILVTWAQMKSHHAFLTVFGRAFIALWWGL